MDADPDQSFVKLLTEHQGVICSFVISLLPGVPGAGKGVSAGGEGGSFADGSEGVGGGKRESGRGGGVLSD